MATRTFYVYGQALVNDNESVELAINFNGSEVFNGPVTTKDSVESEQETWKLCEFTSDTSVTGWTNMSITVTSDGSLSQGVFFSDLHANYQGIEIQTIDGEYQVTTLPVDMVGCVFQATAESDGKRNLVYASGMTPVTRDINIAEGAWAHEIKNGDTLSLEYNIQNTVTEIPTADA